MVRFPVLGFKFLSTQCLSRPQYLVVQTTDDIRILFVYEFTVKLGYGFNQRRAMKKIVAESALKARIRRKLARSNERLVRNSSERVANDLGDYMVVDLVHNTPTVWGLSVYDLVDLAVQIGVLAPFEAVEFKDGTVVEVETVNQ